MSRSKGKRWRKLECRDEARRSDGWGKETMQWTQENHANVINQGLYDGVGRHPFEQSKEGWVGERVQGCWGNKALRDRLADGKALEAVCWLKGERKEGERAGRSRVCLSARGCARACVCAHACGCRSRSRRVLECRGAAASSQSRAAKKARRRRKVHGGGAALLTLSLNHAKEQQRAGDGMHIQTRSARKYAHSLGRWGDSPAPLCPASSSCGCRELQSSPLVLMSCLLG